MYSPDIISIPQSRILEVSRIAFSLRDVDFLCFGESDQPSPRSAHAAAVAALEAGHTRYPDVRGVPALRESIAAYLTGLHAQPVSEERIQIVASGMAALSISLGAVVRAGERVVVHVPIWPNVPNGARARGARLDEVVLTPLPEGGFKLDLDRLAAALPGARACVINSPNNPTGWTATAAELAAILELCRQRGVWLISDEVYSRLIYDGTPAAPSLLDIARADDRVIVCNSFSKAWVMTGWRLGWMVVPAGVRDRIAELVEVTHAGVAPIIQHAGLAAIADRDVVARFLAHCARGRDQVGAALAGLNGVRYRAPDGAFYAFIGVEGVTNSLELAKNLVRNHHVAVAPGVAFGPAGEGHLRICFAQSERTLTRAMERLCAGLRGAQAA
jgi:aspartate/methionine/tyrosine aminotransferase